MHKFLGGAVMALAGILTMFTMQACDNNTHEQSLPVVEASQHQAITGYSVEPIVQSGNINYGSITVEDSRGNRVLCIVADKGDSFNNNGPVSISPAISCVNVSVEK